MLVRIVKFEGTRQVAVRNTLYGVSDFTNFHINSRLDGLSVAFIEKLRQLSVVNHPVVRTHQA